MRDHRSMQIPMTGGSTLLVIFATLCLTVFALLAISTAQADARLAKQGMDSTMAYYAADLRAEEILAELRAGEVPAGVTMDGDGIFTYDCPLSDTQTLRVRVCVSGSEYQILQWQLQSAAEWEPETGLELWDGSDGEGDEAFG